MKIEDQVNLAEQGKRLVELGISKESYFVIDINGTVTESWSIEGTEAEFFPAFTVAELGVMLPIMFWDCMNDKFSDGWEIHYSNSVPSVTLSYYPTEAQARCAMLIYLLENKFITSLDANSRLRV